MCVFIDIHIHSLLLSSPTQDEANGIPNCWSWGGPSVQDPASVPNSATTVAIRPVVLGRTNDIDWNHQLPTDNCWCQLSFFETSPHLMTMKMGKGSWPSWPQNFETSPSVVRSGFEDYKDCASLHWEDPGRWICEDWFQAKVRGWKEKQSEFRSAQKHTKTKQAHRNEMTSPMPTQWLPLECWLVQFNHHNYHHHWYHWYSEIHHLSIINTNQLSRFLRKLQAQPTPGSWKAPPCGTPPSPRALQGSAFRSPSAAGRCGAAGSRAAPPAPTGKWWWWIMCI